MCQLNLEFSPFYFWGFGSSLWSSLNYFSGSLPISSLSIWPLSFYLIPSFAQYFSFNYFIFLLYLFIYLFFPSLLCLRSPFPRLYSYIPSCFWFLPSVGLCRLHFGSDLVYILVGGGKFLLLFLFFPLWWAGLHEVGFFWVSVGILSADDLVYIFVLLLFEWCILHRVLQAVGCCQLLCNREVLCERSH